MYEELGKAKLRSQEISDLRLFVHKAPTTLLHLRLRTHTTTEHVHARTRAPGPFLLISVYY